MPDGEVYPRISACKGSYHACPQPDLFTSSTVSVLSPLLDDSFYWNSNTQLSLALFIFSFTLRVSRQPMSLNALTLPIEHLFLTLSFVFTCKPLQSKVMVTTKVIYCLCFWPPPSQIGHIGLLKHCFSPIHSFIQQIFIESQPACQEDTRGW